MDSREAGRDCVHRLEAAARQAATPPPYAAAPPASAVVGADGRPYSAPSLLDELAPEPPSPYRPRAQKRIASVLPALFHTKAETRRLRDPRVRRLRAAASVAEAAVEESHRPVKRTLGKKRDAAPASESAELVVVKDESAYDEAIREFHFLEAQRELLVKEEDAARVAVSTAEELAYTRLMLAYLDGMALALVSGEDDVQAAAREAQALLAERQAREEERRALLDGIAQAASDRFADERLARKLEVAMSQLMPAHEVGRQAVMAEEAEALRAAFVWEKRNRPLGAACYVAAPVEDPRLRHWHKVKRSKHHRPTTTERALMQLRSRPTSAAGGHAEGVLVVMSSDPNSTTMVVDSANTTPESDYAVEGRQRFQREKSAKHAALRRARAAATLFEEEETARSGVQRAESEAVLPLLRLAVDGVYEARRLARAREQAEAAEGCAAAAARSARDEAKARVLAEESLDGAEAAGEAEAGSPGHGLDSPREAFAVSPLAVEKLAGVPCEGSDEATQANAGRPWNAALPTLSRSVDMGSLIVNPGDLPSWIGPGSPMSLEIVNEEAAVQVRASYAQARATLAQYLREELWVHDLLMPEATAALIASRDSMEKVSEELLMNMASDRADIVNEQIEAVVDLCLPEEL